MYVHASMRGTMIPWPQRMPVGGERQAYEIRETDRQTDIPEPSPSSVQTQKRFLECCCQGEYRSQNFFGEIPSPFQAVTGPGRESGLAEVAEILETSCKTGFP